MLKWILHDAATLVALGLAVACITLYAALFTHYLPSDCAQHQPTRLQSPK